MSRPEGSLPLPCAALLAALALVATAAHAEPAPYRYQAPIAVEAPAPFVQMALPVAAYGHVEQDDLRDLRIVDAKGERVPFAFLPPLATVQLSEQVREASLYPLPARPTADAVWPSPVEVVVEGDRIRVRRRGGPDSTVSDFPAWSPISWSPDARFIAAGRVNKRDESRGIYLIPLSGGVPRAIETLRAAAVREDATEKNAITPGPLAPGRELLGEMLLELGRPADALAEFETALVHEPNRFRSLDGAGTRRPLTISVSKVSDEKARVSIVMPSELGKAPPASERRWIS